MTRPIFLFLFVAVSFSICTVNVYGQSQSLSPWLSLFNNNRGGVLDNYNEFVKPRQDVMKALQSQGSQLQGLQQQQQQSFSSGSQSQLLNDGSTDRVLAEPRMTKSIGGMNGAGFRQYMHWYQGGVQQGGVPNFSPAGQRRR